MTTALKFREMTPMEISAIRKVMKRTGTHEDRIEDIIRDVRIATVSQVPFMLVILRWPTTVGPMQSFGFSKQAESSWKRDEWNPTVGLHVAIGRAVRAWGSGDVSKCLSETREVSV